MLKNFFLVAWRNLAKDKLHTILNLSGLAIGICVCLVIGVWLQRELSFDNFHPNRNQIFRLTNTFKSESESFSQAPSGTAFGAHLTKELPAVKATCRVIRDEFKLTIGDAEFFEPGFAIADSNFFSFFGFRLLKGNPKDVLYSPDKIVLTQSMATKYFGNQDPIGKTITLDDQHPLMVSGIAEDVPLNSHIRFDFVVPFSLLRKIAHAQWQWDIDNAWSGGWPFVYVQLPNPEKFKETEAEINKLVRRFAGKEWEENKMSYIYHLQPIGDIHLKSNLRYDARNNGSLARVRVFSIVGIIILILACINYVNLTTASAIRRAKETAVRKVVGAIKPQLIRQFFLETFIVSTLAVLIGVTFVKLVLPPFSNWIGQAYEFPINTTNLLIMLGFIILVSVLSGLYPATILSSFKPVTTLKGSFSQSTRGNLLRKTLVIFQFTMTIALVASILIISQQMSYIKNRSLGYRGQAVVAVNFHGEQPVRDQYSALRNELMKNPAILNVSKHGGNVVGGLGNGWTTTEDLKGNEISTSLYQFSVDTTYFDTYSMKLAAGRFFSGEFPTDTAKSVLVNEAAVRTFGWQKAENAIGKRFGKGDNARYVIGVVKDFNFESLHKPVEALMMGYAKGGNTMSLKIDQARSEDAIAHLEKTWKTFAPDVPLDYSFIDDTVAEQYGNEQKMKGLFYAFSGLSLLIACLGLFGLSTFVVKRKVKEIGIRKVLGAGIPRIISLLSKDFLRLVFIAFLIATPLSWYFMNKWLEDFAY
ncbi:MAG TPA: ABC transporter permease, partial [Chitinophagaceae bacterium]